MIYVSDFIRPHGWELMMGSIFKDFWFAHNGQITSNLVSTFPVILDTILKYWIFCYLNRVSPSLVVIFQWRKVEKGVYEYKSNLNFERDVCYFVHNHNITKLTSFFYFYPSKRKFLPYSSKAINICLQNYFDIPSSHVSLPNGAQAMEIQEGIVVLNESLILHGILFVPDFHCNLLLVLQLLHTSYYDITFTDKLCTISISFQTSNLVFGHYSLFTLICILFLI